ncbi:hypothetical protein Tco_0079742 [Tanacetum coccineum]
MLKMIAIMEQDSSGEESDQENDSDDDKTQSNNENESDSEHETDENESEIVSPMELHIHLKYQASKLPPLPYSTCRCYHVNLHHILHRSIPTSNTMWNCTDYPKENYKNKASMKKPSKEWKKPFKSQSQQYKVQRVTTLEKEVAELKKDEPFKTQVTALVDEHLYARLGATRDEFMNFLRRQSLQGSHSKLRINYLSFCQRKCLTLPPEKPKRKDKYEDPSTGPDRGLKKRKTSKNAEPIKGPKTKESNFGSSKGDKSQPKSSGKSVQSEELEFEVANFRYSHKTRKESGY